MPREAWAGLALVCGLALLCGAFLGALRVPEEGECDGWADARAKHLGAWARAFGGSLPP